MMVLLMVFLCSGHDARTFIIRSGDPTIYSVLDEK